MSRDPSDLVTKLLALASPKSGTTDAERANAALEVANLVEKHGLKVVPVTEKADLDEIAKMVQPLLALVRRIGLACAKCGAPLDVGALCFVQAAEKKLWCEQCLRRALA